MGPFDGFVSKSIFFNLYCWETFKNTVRPHPQTRVFAASAVTARNTANNLRLAHAVGASACRAKCFTVSSLCQPCSQTYLCRQQSSRPQTICGVGSGPTVFCPHKPEGPCLDLSQDLSIDTCVCVGYIPKIVWLDQLGRRMCVQVNSHVVACCHIILVAAQANV
jgi:hypothetical protein